MAVIVVILLIFRFSEALWTATRMRQNITQKTFASFTRLYCDSKRNYCNATAFKQKCTDNVLTVREDTKENRNQKSKKLDLDLSVLTFNV